MTKGYKTTRSWNNDAVHATCDVFVGSHYAVASIGEGMGKGQYHLMEDVISCEVESTFQASHASITLLPNHPYTSYLFPGDWVSIYMSSNADSPSDFGVNGRPEGRSDNTRVFFGFIEAIRESVQVGRTADSTVVRFSISCVGTQSAFAETNVYFNKALGPNTLFGGFLPGLAQLAYGLPLSGTPATLPRGIAMAYLGHGGQFQMPHYYPTKGFGTVQEREDRLANAFRVAVDVEEALGLAKVRGASGVQKPTLIKRAMEKTRLDILATSFAAVVDMFSYVEDLYVDGRVVNTPFHEQAGSIWNLMVENSNPIMNECFLSLLPERDNVTGQKLLSGGVDEWGQRPALTPCLVVRERPFGWKQIRIETDSSLKGLKSPNMMFGDVFFSDRSEPWKYANRYPQMQQTSNSKDFVSPTGRPTDILQQIGSQLKRSIRAVDRIKLPMQYISSETLGFSHNDMFNFFMITMSGIPLQKAYQDYTLLLDGLIPIFYPESIKKYGLRLKEMSTKFMYTGSGEIATGKGLDFLVRCLLAYDHWYQHAAYYRAGTISCRPVLSAQPGMVLDVSGPGREESFYVEGVTLEYSQNQNGSGGTFAQTLTVTRGQPSGFSDPKLRFPYAPPDPVRMYEVDSKGNKTKEIIRPNAPVQPKVKRPPDEYYTDEGRKKKLDELIFIEAQQSGNLKAYEEWGVSVEAQKSLLGRDLTADEELGVWITSGGLTDPALNEKVVRSYTEASRKRDLPPVIPVKQDRTYAGKAPYARKPWKGKIWTAARLLLWRTYTGIRNTFKGVGLSLKEEKKNK